MPLCQLPEFAKKNLVFLCQTKVVVAVLEKRKVKNCFWGNGGWNILYLTRAVRRFPGNIKRRNNEGSEGTRSQQMIGLSLLGLVASSRATLFRRVN